VVRSAERNAQSRTGPQRHTAAAPPAGGAGGDSGDGGGANSVGQRGTVLSLPLLLVGLSLDDRKSPFVLISLPSSLTV